MIVIREDCGYLGTVAGMVFRDAESPGWGRWGPGRASEIALVGQSKV